MKGFVASWFFPPSTSAEGLVTFKLLKNSSFQYDVCSSLSKQWSYKENSALTAPNIHTLFVDTNDLNVWVKKAIRIFEKKHQEDPYDFIMTRSMPPESIKVGLYIKKKYPSVKWIASFADPIGKNPYELLAYISNNSKIKGPLKPRAMYYPDVILPILNIIPDSGIQLMNKLLMLEKRAFKQADMFIFPSYDQCSYSLGIDIQKYKNKCLILPHSYDRDLYPKTAPKTNEKICFTYIGYADNLRTPKPFIKALKIIKDIHPQLLEKIQVKIIGNIPEDIEDMVQSYFLYDTVSVLPSVNYQESLHLMQVSDWLLHIEAIFSFLPNESIFFASKVADYIGAQKPIFAIAGENSTVSRIVKKVGGVSAIPWEVDQIAQKIVDIIKDPHCLLSESERKKYDAIVIAKQFDSAILSGTGNLEDAYKEAMA